MVIIIIQEDVNELEHCQHCLDLFPLDEIVSHSMICPRKGASAKRVSSASVHVCFIR